MGSGVAVVNQQDGPDVPLWSGSQVPRSFRCKPFTEMGFLTQDPCPGGVHVWYGRVRVCYLREDAGHGAHLGRQDPRWMMSFHPVASFRGRYRRFSGAPSFRPHKGVSMETNRVMGILKSKQGRKSLSLLIASGQFEG